MGKPREREEARKLRHQGKSIKKIAKKIDVSPSSVRKWTFDIRLSPSQKKRLKDNVFEALQRGRKTAAAKQRTKKLKEINLLRSSGMAEVGELSQRELFLVGIALYWSEGFKKDSRLGFANSDPNMIKLFLKWLIENCRVPTKDIRVRVGLNISHENRIREVEEYWSKVTKIPLTNFQKPFFQKFAWKKEFKKPNNYFGVLRIRANKQRILFRKINGWIEGLKLNTAG
jgi:transposase-like protein